MNKWYHHQSHFIFSVSVCPVSFWNKVQAHILKQPTMWLIRAAQEKKKKHKPVLSPSSPLLVQWLTFEFMSIFALASDKVFYEFLPSRQLGLNLSGPRTKWPIMAVPLKVIIFLLYLSIPCTNKMETSGQRQDNLLRSYFIPYTSFMPNWFADPPKDRLPYVINAENMKISFLLPINSHLEWLLTTKLFGSTLTDDWSLLFSVEIGQKQEDLSFSKFLMNNKVCQGNTNSVPSHPQKHSKKKKNPV